MEWGKEAEVARSSAIKYIHGDQLHGDEPAAFGKKIATAIRAQ